MNYLLKIVQGANAGAEIALAEGVVTFGSSDACDIVLADSSMPAEAFALETTDAGVSLKPLPDGEAKKVEPYTTFAFGGSVFAVGENGVAWPELKSPETAAPAPEPEVQPEASAPVPEPAAVPPPAEPKAEDEPPAKRRRGLGCLLVLLLVLLFFVAGYILALLYGRFWEGRGIAFFDGGGDAPETEEVQPAVGIEDWAATNGVALLEKDGEKVLSGNFAKRADRLAFAQDALVRDAELKLDLSDDETLKSGVEEVLFVLTEGRTKLDVATNRVGKLSGRARSREELLQTVAAICTDVNRVRIVDDTSVVCDDGLKTDAPTRYQALSEKAAKRHPFMTPPAKPGMPAPKCPVAGVILMPYPCLVLRDGSRAAEGAMVGEFKVEKIEADKVTLKRGGETITWKP